MLELYEQIWDDRVKKDMSLLTNTYASVRDKNKVKKELGDLNRYESEYKGMLRRYTFYLQELLDIEDLDVRRSFYGVQRSKFGGRISHFLSNAPKLYRRRLLIDGAPVIEVDIKASQPSFLYVLFRKWYYSSHKSLADTSHSYENSFELVKRSKIDIYQYMILKLFGLKEINDPIRRNEVKTLFYRLIFGSPSAKVGGFTKRELCAKLFGYDFYEFLERLSKGTLDWDIDKRYKNLSALLQREESSFMDAIMSELEQIGIAFIPIYDSLIVKEIDREKALKIFDVIAGKGFYKGVISLM